MKHLMSALFLLVASTAGAEELKKIEPVDPSAKYDNACASAAADLVSHVMEPKFDEYVRMCNRNPNKGICEETQKMVDEVRVNYRFVCTGGG